MSFGSFQQLMEESPPLLPPHHRRLRHVKSIVARNIKSPLPQTLTDCFYTLHVLEENIKDPFYTSEVVKDSMNPNWRHLDSHTIPQNLHGSFRFVAKVWSTYSETILLFEKQIDMTTFEYIGTELKNSSSFSPNSLVFELLDGYYCLSNPSIRHDFSKSSTNQRPMGMTCNSLELLQLISLCKQDVVTETQTKEFIEEIHSRLDSNRCYAQKLQTRDMTRLSVNHLKQEYETHLKMWQEEKLLVQNKRRELIPQVRTVSKAEISLLASKKILAEDKKRLENDLELCEKISVSITNRKWNLISHLRTVYPVSQSSDGKTLALAGFRLPNSDFTGCDEEQIATALGFVCHIIFMISKYLEVPLRYPMIPMCSRSVIRDDISQQVSPKFPLYSRGVDRTRFEYAVFLLNKNLEQLLNSQGLDVITLRHTLPNLQILLGGR